MFLEENSACMHGGDTPKTRKHSRPVRRKQQYCLIEPHPLATAANSTDLDSPITFPPLW